MKMFLNLVACCCVFILPNTVQANCIKGNCQNGHGTYVFKSGSKYEGNFRDGKLHGKGIFYFTSGNKYMGDWVNQYREGEGKMIFKEGHEYTGGFQKNKFYGTGTMKYANGDEYQGNWDNDQPNGTGTFRKDNGDWYEGEFENGKYQGEGTMNYADGYKYVGRWKKGKKHGNGTLYHPDGTTELGEWVNGTRLQEEEDITWIADNAAQEIEAYSRDCNTIYCQDGTGSYKYGDGSRYVGTFLDGAPEGRGTIYYTNGDQYEGGWSQHAPHGEGVMTYSTGRVVGAMWEYGKPEKILEADETAIAETQVEKDVDEQVKIWAVVVGVARYAHMPTLKYTDDDAYQIFAFLKSPEGGALPDNQIKVLIDEDATRANILTAMRNVMLKADENDVVMFYFSGHGLEGSFLPVDYDGYANRVKHEEIKSYLAQSKAKHKLVLADACHSGSLLAMKKPMLALNKYYKAFEDSKGGTALMMSSKSEEYSLEDGGLRSGIFSYYLRKGLKGLADQDQDKIVTVSELFDYVYSNVQSYTGNIQTPTLSGNYDMRMPVAVIR